MALSLLSRKESPRDCDRQEVTRDFVEQKSASHERSSQLVRETTSNPSVRGKRDLV